MRDSLELVRRLKLATQRQRTGLFVAEGVRQVVQAHDRGWVFDRLLVSDKLLKNTLARMLVRRLARNGVAKANLSPEQYRRASTEERASGVIAVLRQRWVDLAGETCGRGLWLGFESMRSPGNLGTILRTAAALGAEGLVALTKDIDPYDPAVVRASMGGLFHLKTARATVRQLERWAGVSGRSVIALSPQPHGGSPDFQRRSPVLMIGDERQGLSPQLLKIANGTLSLPMPGWGDSLNVAVAAGVAMYQLQTAPTASGGQLVEKPG